MKKDVLVADPEVLEEKLAQIRAAGGERICVVADWDRTLTRAQTEDGKDTTSYLALVHSGYLGEVYRQEMDRLYREYRPIEVAQDVLAEAKSQAMCDWWAAAFALMQAHGLTEVMIEEIGRRDLMCLRDGVAEFLQVLTERGIPLLILSAGIGNVIEGFLRARGLLAFNLRVQANMLRFGRDGVVDGFTEPVIHSMNKRVDDHLADVGSGGVLLLGDTLEDVQMVDGANCECVIRVGFLNEEVEKNKDRYTRVYDVVICGDGNWDCVNDLWRQLMA